MNLADRLHDLRKKSGYSQEQLADLLGISRQAISKWESGQGKPDLDNIIKLTELYNISADYIITGQDFQKNDTDAPHVHAAPSAPVPSAESSSSRKELHPITRKTIGCISIIAATALVTLLLIIALGFVSKYLP